jgi:hypothetical protein
VNWTGSFHRGNDPARAANGPISIVEAINANVGSGFCVSIDHTVVEQVVVEALPSGERPARNGPTAPRGSEAA